MVGALNMFSAATTFTSLRKERETTYILRLSLRAMLGCHAWPIRVPASVLELELGIWLVEEIAWVVSGCLAASLLVV